MPGLRRDWSVVVRSTWDRFAGFSTRSSAAQAAFEHAASLNNHVFVNRKIEEEVRLSWQGVQTSCHRRVLLRKAVNIAAEVWEARVAALFRDAKHRLGDGRKELVVETNGLDDGFRGTAHGARALGVPITREYAAEQVNDGLTAR